MADLKPIDRTSLSTSLADRYDNASDLANVGGGSAKNAGKGPKGTDFISTGDKDFQVKVAIATDDSSNALANYNKSAFKNVQSTKYAPSGRLP